jgi:hypothetical protein
MASDPRRFLIAPSLHDACLETAADLLHCSGISAEARSKALTMNCTLV